MTDPINFDDKKRKTAKKVKEILDGAETKPAKKPRKKITSIKGNVININSKGNKGQIAGGDIHNNINKKEIIRPKIVPGPDQISSACALKIRDGIKVLVEMDVEAGSTSSVGALFAKWHGRLKKFFQVVSYRDIPVEHEQTALEWIKNQKVSLRPSIRRTSNALWRKQHTTGIYSRANELGMSKADVYLLVKERLGKSVFSLKQLGEQDLTRLYQIMFKLPRPT